MKIKITTDQYSGFLKALQHAEKISSGRKTLPVLSCVLLTTHKDRLTIQAHNLDQAILISVPVDVKEEGRVGIVGADLLRIAGLSESLDLEADKKGATVKCGGTFKLPIVPVDDFPPMPEMEKATETTFTSSELFRVMACIYAACQPRDNKYQLQGVHLNPEAKQGVASDGRVMAMSSFPVADKGWGPIIPDKACRLMMALADEADSFEFAFTEAWARLRADDLTFYTRLIEGNYPNFRNAIPREETWAVKVNRKGLIDALSRAVVAQSDTNRADLRITKGTLSFSITGKNAESETSVELEGDVPKKGEGFAVGFSSVYLRSIVSAMTEETISLEFIDNLSPMAIRGGGYAVLSLMRTK